MPADEKIPEAANSLETGSVIVGGDPHFLFEVGQHAFEYWAHQMSELTDEMSHFAEARLREDIRTWSDHRKHLGEPLEYQRRFAQAITEYLDQASRLCRIVMRIAGQAFPASQTKEDDQR